MSFLSIIIPVYKVEPYLRECLDSIAISPLQCWEAILIDDGSPDGCPKICDEYVEKDKRFRVIHQKNAGVAAARNAGLDVAWGEWVWFVDSDDVVDMRYVEGIVSLPFTVYRLQDSGAVQKQKVEVEKVDVDVNAPVDLLMFDLDTFKDGEPIAFGADTTVPMVRDEMLDKNEFLLRHVCYHHPRLWYRRGLVNNNQRPIRFTKGIRVAEDLEFQYKYLTLCQHPVKVNAVLYYYRLRETSVTGDAAYRQRAVEDLPIVLRNLATWAKENQVQPEPWYDYRIMKLLQNCLYSASVIYQSQNHNPSTVNSKLSTVNCNLRAFQKEVRAIVREYRALGFPFVKDVRIWLAKKNVKAYFLFYKTYLKLKGIQS